MLQHVIEFRFVSAFIQSPIRLFENHQYEMTETLQINTSPFTQNTFQLVQRITS